MLNGLLARVDRIKALGNAVVPLQAREALGAMYFPHVDFASFWAAEKEGNQ